MNNLKLYQQLAIYFIPIIGNMVFINMTVVVVRLGLFERRIKEMGDFVCFYCSVAGLLTEWTFSTGYSTSLEIHNQDSQRGRQPGTYRRGVSR